MLTSEAHRVTSTARFTSRRRLVRLGFVIFLKFEKSAARSASQITPPAAPVWRISIAYKKATGRSTAKIKSHCGAL